MKRLILMISVLALLASFTGCSGNAGSNHPAVTPMNRDQAIQIARDAARTFAELYLQSQYKIPITLTDAAFSIIDTSVIDPALKGGAFRAAVDPEQWRPIRAKLISDGTTKLAGVKKKDGSPLVDQADAELLVTKLVDGVAQVENTYANEPAAPPTTAPPAATSSSGDR